MEHFGDVQFLLLHCTPHMFLGVAIIQINTLFALLIFYLP